jgi:putative endonuclease
LTASRPARSGAKTAAGAAKKRARRFGLRAEWIAAALLAAKGYRILARHFLVAGGEIDLIVKRRGTIAFVEVRARADFDDALASIGAVKQRRIGRAARVWLSRNPSAVNATLRGDAVLVAGGLPRHVVGAFDLALE